MSTLRYNDGGVTVTLDGGLDAFVRQALDAAGGEALTIVEELAEEVAAEAGAAWYGPDGVTKRTGKSGQIDVVETVSPDEVRVSVGSLDLDKAKYVHRPGRLSTTVEEITKEVYETAKNRPGAALVFHARRDRPGITKGAYYRVVHNPLAKDGKYLLSELVTKPARARLKASATALGEAIAARVGGE